MKKNILERYNLTNDGKYIIDITTDKIEDLYNDFDKHSSYAIKELDENLVNYIIDSARDIGNSDFIVQFRLISTPDPSLKERIYSSVHSYFLYLKETEKREFLRKLRTSVIFLVVGISIMFLSVQVNQSITSDTTVATKVFAEGLTVAAWVSLWEALATFLVNWTPYTRLIKMYGRIARSPIIFTTD